MRIVVGICVLLGLVGVAILFYWLRNRAMKASD
jgi:hypothetical protein